MDLRSLQLLRAAGTAAAMSLGPAGGALGQATPPPTNPPGISPSTATDRAGMEASFTRADTDTDNRLSKTEAAALPAIGTKFDTLDRDKDGFLNLEEFAIGYNAPP